MRSAIGISRQDILSWRAMSVTKRCAIRLASNRGSLMPLTNGVHRNDGIHRTFVVKPWLTVTLPDAASSADAIIEERRQRILDMAAALSAMFGDAALPIAEGQPGTFDVGGRSGIRWQDLADELRTAKLPHTIAIPPTP